MSALKPEPDWLGAARALTSAIASQPTADARVDVVEACRAELGDQLYPAFIKLLMAVARFGDDQARRITAETLGHACAVARAPTVRVPAWGASPVDAPMQPFGSGLLNANLRTVGPLEYLCLWSPRQLSRDELTEDAFEAAVQDLLELLFAHPDAAQRYAARMLEDLETPLEGLHTAVTQRLVRTLGEGMLRGEPAGEVAARLRDMVEADRRADRWSRPPG